MTFGFKQAFDGYTTSVNALLTRVMPFASTIAVEAKLMHTNLM